jgi:hypothetical protein
MAPSVKPPPAAPLKQGPDPSRYPGGHAQQGTDNSDNRKFLWVGFITDVDYETMVCCIRFETGNSIERDVPIPAMGGAGPRSWSGSMPEKGSKVVCSWRKFGDRSEKPHIVAYLSPGTYAARNFEPFSSADPNEIAAVLEEAPELEYDTRFNWETIRLKSRKIYPGDYISSSSSGSDIMLDRDVTIHNRAGNEFKLRDSDQTSVLNVLNEFSSNAAGIYARGLIKRNAMSFLPEYFALNKITDGVNPWNITGQQFYEQKVDPSHPAFEVLQQLSLIKDDGSPTFAYDQGITEYPYVVPPDGVRVNFVTQGKSMLGFDSTPLAYTEDRREIRHVSNGIMGVNEEVDGVTIDFQKELYIEDVHGTVVGNDFTPSEAKNYKRILTMRLFNDKKSGILSAAPAFEPIDVSNQDRYSVMDDVALARLYRLKSPNTSNEYAFGISKQGKVFLHIPAAVNGLPDERGGSVDANIQGLIKAVVGKDPASSLSADIRLKGGLHFEVGRGPNGNSIDLTLQGPIKTRYVGTDTSSNTPTVEQIVTGGIYITSTDSTYHGSSAGYTINAGGAVSISSSAVKVTANDTLNLKSSGSLDITVLGSTSQTFSLNHTSTYSLNRSSTLTSGIDTTTVLAGGIVRTVNAGTGINDSVTTGSIISNVTTGNMLLGVASGTFSVSVGTGSLSLVASSGPLSTQATTTLISSNTNTSIVSPTTFIGSKPVGFAVAGIPGPGGPHIDYITGLPILGIPTISIG